MALIARTLIRCTKWVRFASYRMLTCLVHRNYASPFKAMQPSQDDEYPWVDDNDNDVPLHHAEAEWTSLSTNFTTVSERTDSQ